MPLTTFKKDKPSFKILIVGELKKGKSSSINTIINAAAGVKFNEPFRYKVYQSISEYFETEMVMSYKIPELNYPQIEIIDCPGVGEGRGYYADMQQIKKIQTFL